jgi:hypothetical protein
VVLLSISPEDGSRTGFRNVVLRLKENKTVEEAQKNKFTSLVIYVQPSKYRSRFAPVKTVCSALCGNKCG